jgi:putative phosphoesterase
VGIENKKSTGKLIGVISDTHNLLRPEAVEALRNVDLIIHAGDFCKLTIIEELEKIAPVIVVRGNNDKGSWTDEIPICREVEIEGILLYIIHDIKDMNVHPASPGINVVISGHTHKPLIKENNDILYLNPGSAGSRRFNLPVTIGKLKINGSDVKAELTHLL